MSWTERLHLLLEDKNRAGEFSGVVLVQQDAEVLFAKAHGYANRSWRVKNRLDTRFRIASIGKLFTAVAILQLIEQGKLALDTPVVAGLNLSSTALPPEATVYHLLTMTAGLADWFDESGDWQETWAALSRDHPIYLLRQNADYLPLFANKPAQAPVGEKHAYSNASYILLGLLIEQLAGRSYFDVIRQHIFAPAGMARSDFLALDDVADEVAEGYIRVTDEHKEFTGWQKNIYATTAGAAADGGATSTAQDLVRFSQALRRGLLLLPEMTQAMLRPKVVASDEAFRGYLWRYGFGNTFLLDQAEQIIRWGHTGEEEGVSCRLYHYPGLNVDVAILANQSWCAGDIGWAIHDVLLAGV
jgi:CubicO group peptidase (beta-lactamase class C family)